MKEREILDWYDNPVTKAFFDNIHIRVNGFKIGRGEGDFLRPNVEENHRLNWEIQGGIEELEYISDKENVVDIFGLEEEEAA